MAPARGNVKMAIYQIDRAVSGRSKLKKAKDLYVDEEKPELSGKLKIMI